MSESEIEKKIYQIPLDQIVEPSEAIRSVITREGLEELADSIRAVGVLQPLTLKKQGEKYEIVAGHRRFLAARMAMKSAVPCIVLEDSTVDFDLVKLHENISREDISPVDEARWFSRLQAKFSFSAPELAKFVSRSEAYVRARLTLLGANERILSALEAKHINLSQARELISVDDQEVAGKLLAVAVESGATVRSLQLMRRDFELQKEMTGSISSVTEIPGGEYERVKHLIECPVCKGRYGVNYIYPISVCKSCYDGFLAGLREAEREEAKK